MTLYKNQRVVVIHRDKVKKGDLYFSSKLDNMYFAMCNFSNSELKLWIYLVGNAEGWEFAFSPAAIIKRTGLSESSVHTAWKGLVDKGYLHLVEGTKNKYYFTEVSDKMGPKEEEKAIEEKRGILDEQTGEVVFLAFSELARMGKEVGASEWAIKKKWNEGVAVV